MPSPLQVVVYGDIQFDEWYLGDLGGFARESAAAPNLINARYHINLGGAANVAANVAAQGVPVRLTGFVGSGDDYRQLEQLCHAADVRVTAEPCLSVTNRNIRLAVNPSHVLARTSLSSRPSYDAVVSVLNFVKVLLRDQQSILVLSDGGRGAFDYKTEILGLIKHAKAAGALVLVDPQPGHLNHYRGATLIKPSQDYEKWLRAEYPGGWWPANPQGMSRHVCAQIHGHHEVPWVLLTRGGEGMFLSHNTDGVIIDEFLRSEPQPVHDVTGAGDTVIATMAAGLAGYEPEKSVSWHNVRATALVAHAAGSLAVAKPGVAVITKAEAAGERLRRWRKDHDSLRNFKFESDLLSVLAYVKAAGRPICWVNGCFDILHQGHLRLFQAARDVEDSFVVVLVNSDQSVRALKGPDRPRVPLEQRMAILSALSTVDAVFGFQGSNPNHLLSVIQPTYLVKGDEYRTNKDASWMALVQHAQLHSLGKPLYVPMVPGVSSTSLIAPIPETPNVEETGGVDHGGLPPG